MVLLSILIYILSNFYIDNKITGDVLVHLSQADLAEIGVYSIGHRLKILKAIYLLIVDRNLEVKDHYIPPTVLEASSKLTGNTIIHNANGTSDQDRLTVAESEIRKLGESFSKLREDLLPVYRIVKESKPLPTPELPRAPTPPVSSPTQLQAISRKVSKHSPNSQDWLDTSFINSSNASTISSKDSRKTPHYGGMNKQPSMSSIQSQSESMSRVVTPTISSRSSSANISIMPGVASSSSSVNLMISGSNPHSQPIKDFNISPDVPCYKVLPQIARRHKVRGDWRGVGLVVCYDDQERMIGLEEKPLAIYKELQREGKNPIFMIREDNGLKSDNGFVVNGTPGGLL